MTNKTRSDIQNEQGTLAQRPEQTRPGPVYRPAVDIFEDENAITLLADLPGVKASDLTIDLRENTLTLTGRITPPEQPGEVDIMREYRAGTYVRQFTLAETIDQPKIAAKLSGGVLRLELPKVEKVKPRQIAVQSN
jgi:HSP20 family molecular chaperone IbpA